MKVYKALRLKKNLISAIIQTTELIQENNSIQEDNEFEFNINELLQKRKELVSELIELKQRLAKTAMQIQIKIFELSELKMELSMYKNLDTIQGTTSIRYSDNIIKRKVQLSKADILVKINEVVNKIDNVQTEIDEFNYSTELI